MDLDEELENLEDGETEAELIDQETELEDYESDDDQLFDEDSTEEDYEHAYENFMDTNETDYNGWKEERASEQLEKLENAQVLNGEGYHVIDRDGLKDEAAQSDADDSVEEIEIDEDQIEAYIVDENDKEIGFIVLDENGKEQEYYYADSGDDDVMEIEIDEDDIEAYIVDENDNEIGFIIIDEDGNEQEYFYAEDFDDTADEEVTKAVSDALQNKALTDRKAKKQEDDFDLGITREGVAEATQDMNAIYQEGKEIAGEFKEAYDDLSETFSFFKKKRR